MIETAGVGLVHPKESGLPVCLDPGVYTVHLRGATGDTGVGIIAVDRLRSFVKGSPVSVGFD